MIYCFDSALRRDYSKREMQYAKEKNIGILYDSKLNTFIDFSGKQVDISGEIIFPRTGAKQVYKMNEEIIKKGGIPILTNSQIDTIMDWPFYYSTERKTKIIKGRELINQNTIKQIEKSYGDTIFIKTKDKNFNSIIPINLLKDKECVFYKTLEYHLDEDFIISEKVQIEEDEFDLKEYRCFVVDNQLFNISRYTDTIVHSVDESILYKALEIIEKMKNKFPDYYVFDLFEYSKDGKTNIDVVEFNPISSSGLYLYNSVMNKSEDILHKHIYNIPEEFLGIISELQTEGKMFSRGTNLYNISGTFANDLRSIFLIGQRGIVFAFDIDLTVENMASHRDVEENSLLSDFFGETDFEKDEEIPKRMSLHLFQTDK